MIPAMCAGRSLKCLSQSLELVIATLIIVIAVASQIGNISLEWCFFTMLTQQYPFHKQPTIR